MCVWVAQGGLALRSHRFKNVRARVSLISLSEYSLSLTVSFIFRDSEFIFFFGQPVKLEAPRCR